MSLPCPRSSTRGRGRVYRVPYRSVRPEPEWAAATGSGGRGRRTARRPAPRGRAEHVLPAEFELFVGGRSVAARSRTAGGSPLPLPSLDHVTQVVVTLDTHTAAQIFHRSSGWAGRRAPRAAHRHHARDLESGRWRVNPTSRRVAPRRASTSRPGAGTTRAASRGRQVPVVCGPTTRWWAGSATRWCRRRRRRVLPRDRPAVADRAEVKDRIP